MSQTLPDALVSQLDRFTPSGDGWKARCPAHDDRTPSLSIGIGDNDRVLLTCHAGCTFDAIVEALGIEKALLQPSSNGHTPAGGGGDYWLPGGLRAITVYIYVSAAGKEVFRVHRGPDKQFFQSRPDPSAPYGRRWSTKGLTQPIYRLPRVIEAVGRGESVYVVEGEKDVHALEDAGETATCNPGGAGKWKPHHSKPLENANVIIVADNDKPGLDHARGVRESLTGVAANVTVVRAADGCKDAYDHLAAGHSVDDFVPLEDVSDPGVFTPPETRATVQPVPVEPPAIASDLRILGRLAKTAVALGVVGEERVVATAYLALTSRLLPKQVSLVVKGHSASGKSFAVEQVTRLFPDDATIVFTAMSQRALIYSDEEYAHRTLVVYEATGLREGNDDDLTSYLIRSLLSEGRIVYPVTERGDDGHYSTRKIIKEGPTNLILTTTKIAVHQENETRLLSLTTNDSAEQTKAVLAALAADIDRNVDVGEWVQLQRWLEQHGNREVVISYAPALAELIQPVAVRLRRDFTNLQALISAHAMLHQLNRDTDRDGRIVATLDDYEEVHKLVARVLGEAVAAGVSKETREVVDVVAKACPEGSKSGIKATVVAERLNLDKSAAFRRLQKAARDGYITNLEDRRGRPGRWAPDGPLPEDVPLLPKVDVLRQRLHDGCTPVATPHATAATDENDCGVRDSDLPEAGGCTVARESGRDREGGQEAVSVEAGLLADFADDAPAVEIPPNELGPCVRCHTRFRRYGPHGEGPLCPACRNGDTTLDTTPDPLPAAARLTVPAPTVNRPPDLVTSHGYTINFH